MCACVSAKDVVVQKGEMPVEAQIVTDGLERNQTVNQDLCPGTSQSVSQGRLVCL